MPTRRWLSDTDRESSNMRLKMHGFNHQNAIFGMSIVQCERESNASPYFAVELEQSFGIGSTFKCLGIEVADAIPWNDDFETHSSLLRS